MSIVSEIILGIFLTIGVFLFKSESKKIRYIGFFIIFTVWAFLLGNDIATGAIPFTFGLFVLTIICLLCYILKK